MQPSNQWLINLSKNESLWTQQLDSVPSMIYFEYAQLKSLAREGQVYGVLLQCKDTYETILKIPVIMTLVIIDSDPKYKDGAEYAEIMKAFLESPMSMGNWDNLARVIVSKNKNLQLPEDLIEILKRTRRLYSAEITATVSNVVNWRNETIGHGALKFQDDVSYQEEVSSLLTLLKEYFSGVGKFSIKGLYDDCYFQCGENKLVAGCYERNIDNVSMSLHVAAQTFPVANYVNDCDLKWYLFESFYRRKNLVKYNSFIDGKNNTIQNKYFSDLFAKHVLQGSKASAVTSDYISREEDLILEYLHMPSDYVAPTRIVELLQEKMAKIEKGVITISMERGTGKSAFANKMSGLYHPKPLMKNSLSRCYHVSNAALRGLSDFTNSINNGFRHSFNPADDFWGSTEELPSLSLETDNPAESMAEFLNFYHEKYRKDYTILIIDGIDETTEQAERILDYIPSKDQLEDGVFVVLTTRFADEETVKGKSKKYIDKAAKLADSLLEVRRHDEINVDLLNRYIDHYTKTFKFEQHIDKETLIEKSDYRILYLRAYLGISDRVDLDNTNETKFIKSYMDYILSFYGISQKQTLKEIAVSIALFPGISIKQYQEYLNCQEITYEFVGLFNDLMPLLTVTHLDGEDVYEFADTAYADFVIEQYSDIVKDVIHYFNDSLKVHLGLYLKNGRALQSGNTTENRNEKKINESIMFFSEGLLGIWYKSKFNSLLFNLFFSNLNVFNLARQLIRDEWSSIGYGFIIKREIINVLVEGLYLSLQNKSGKACETWARKVTNALNKSEGYYFLENLRYTSKFIDLYKYLLKNYERIKNIKYWFWALMAFDDYEKIRKIVKEKGEEYNFAVYCRVGSKEQYEKIFGPIDSPKIEEQVLNCLIYHYRSKGDIERIKTCIGLIEKKGYKLYNKHFLQYFNKPVKQKRDNSIIDNACEILQNFSLPLNNTTLLKKIVDCISLSNRYKWKDIPINLKNLYHAFYKRLCFEKENGNIERFLESICHYFAICNLPFECLLRELIDANFAFYNPVEFVEYECSCNRKPLGGLLVNGIDNNFNEYDKEGLRVLSPLNKTDFFEEPTINSFEAEPFINNISIIESYNLQQHIEVNVTEELETNGIFNSDFEVDAFINKDGRIQFEYYYNNEDEVLQLIMNWIKELKDSNYVQNKYTNLLLFILMTVPIEFEYYRCIKLEKPLLTLEELVFTTDTCAFLFWCFKCCGVSLSTLNKIQTLHGHIYCTDNALILLRRYFENGEFDQFNTLLSKMEETIPLIDKYLITNRLTEAMCEIQKYRFLMVRRNCRCYNNFDQYIIESVSNRIKKIIKLIKDFSTDKDFVDVAYNIELLLEFAWQTRDWKVGKSYCQLLINLLNEKIGDCTYIQTESIKDEILVVENCKRVFSLLANEKDEAINCKVNMVSSYNQLVNQNVVTGWGSGPRVTTFFHIISDIQDEGKRDMFNKISNGNIDISDIQTISSGNKNDLRNRLSFILNNVYGCQIDFFRGFL